MRGLATCQAVNMTERNARAEEFIHKAIKSYERVIYARNPLVQVVAQIRFPTILSLETAGPARLQEAIIDIFPILETGQVFTFAMNGPDGSPNPGKPTLSHNFYSFDRKWQLGLTTNSASLSTNSYENWDSFRDRLHFALGHVYSLYKIPIISRVGLRYQDVIDREALGIGRRPWSELISDDLLGFLRNPDVDESFLVHSHASNVLVIGLVKILMQYGLFAKPNTADNVYLIDADLYIDQERAIDSATLRQDFDNLHDLAGPMFRWSITEKLHDALKSA
jgi:uncharacterized protein (TIGR04255 family)